MRVVIIAAVSKLGAIGLQGSLPWRLPKDLAHFKKVTSGHPVIMGRSTYESLPASSRPLPGRENIVLSRKGKPIEEATVVTSAAAATAAAKKTGAEVCFVIGGAEVYALFLESAHELLLTEVEDGGKAAGDVYFPKWNKNEYEAQVVERHEKDAENDYGFTVMRYTRKK